MNPGNTKPKTPKPKSGGVDNFVERLNKGFGKLLGRKDNSPPPKETSNAAFSIIILGACLLLWICTGFYFLGENEYAIIQTNGKIADVKRGIKVGLTLPYPFGNVEIIDALPSKLLTIGDNSTKSFIVLDENLKPVSISAKFSYQIDNPKVLYQNHLQDQDTFDTEVLWQVQSKIRDIVATRSISELGAANFTVLSKEVLGLLSPSLASYGIILNKFTIVSIQGINSEVSKENAVVTPIQFEKQPLSVQLQAEAARYNENEVAMASSESKEFDMLLAAYRKNASQTVTKMYNDTLNKIPVSDTDNKYDLLFLNLKELKQIGLTGIDQRKNINDGRRVFTREVVRDRGWMDE
ncbi:MAG TPA: SPFH domain-containing protein [Aquella sp.]|nr:SPFH domain-containing protein [Aquella sp.]